MGLLEHLEHAEEGGRGRESANMVVSVEYSSDPCVGFLHLQHVGREEGRGGEGRNEGSANVVVSVEI